MVVVMSVKFRKDNNNNNKHQTRQNIYTPIAIAIAVDLCKSTTAREVDSETKESIEQQKKKQKLRKTKISNKKIK